MEPSHTADGNLVLQGPPGAQRPCMCVSVQPQPSCRKHPPGLNKSQRKPGFRNGSAGKESTCSAGDTRDTGLIPGSGRFPGGGDGCPLQDSCWRISWTEEPGRLCPQCTSDLTKSQKEGGEEEEKDDLHASKRKTPGLRWGLQRFRSCPPQTGRHVLSPPRNGAAGWVIEGHRQVLESPAPLKTTVLFTRNFTQKSQR